MKVFLLSSIWGPNAKETTLTHFCVTKCLQNAKKIADRTKVLAEDEIAVSFILKELLLSSKVINNWVFFILVVY